MAVCEYKPCSKVFYFLLNEATGNLIPVDAETISKDEMNQLLIDPKSVHYNKSRHISHFKTCLDPNRFSKRKKNK